MPIPAPIRCGQAGLLQKSISSLTHGQHQGGGSDRRHMTTTQIYDKAGQFGRRRSKLAPGFRKDWLRRERLACKAGLALSRFIVPLLALGIGQACAGLCRRSEGVFIYGRTRPLWTKHGVSGKVDFGWAELPTGLTEQRSLKQKAPAGCLTDLGDSAAVPQIG